MRIEAGALTLFLLSSSSTTTTEAFGTTSRLPSTHTPFLNRQPLPSPPTSSLHQPPKTFTRPSSSTTQLHFGNDGGITELEAFSQEGDFLTKNTAKNPTLFKLTGYAAIPASLVLGAVLTPSRRMAASAVGSVVSGIAGYVGKNRLDLVTETGAAPALARTVVGVGLSDVSKLTEAVEDLQNMFGIDDDDYRQAKIQVYRRYLTGVVKTPVTKTGEMKELQSLKEGLDMDNMAVGEAHAQAANDFYRQTCLYTPVEDLDDPGHPDRMSIDKFIFLSERVFRQGGETDEAFTFEMSRVAKAFEVTLPQAKDRVAGVANPFYERALASAREKFEGGKVDGKMLARARNSLGIDAFTAQEMHLQTYSKELRSLLGKEEVDDEDDDEDEEEETVDPATLKFKSGDKERLAKLQEILGIEDREADYELYSETTPLFQAVALAATNDAVAGTITPEKVWQIIKVRQGELLLKDSSAKDLLASVISSALGKPLEETLEFAKVNNEAATFDKLMDALQAKDVCSSVLKASGWDGFEDFEARFCDPNVEDSATAFLSASERTRLYRIVLDRAVRKSETGKELTDELYEKVKAVQSLLGVKDDETKGELTTSFGPELQKTLSSSMLEIMGDDYTPELLVNLKKMRDEVVQNYRLTEDVVASFAGPIYSRAVAIVSDRTPSNIPTAEDSVQLNAVRELLGMKVEATYDVHLSVFGSAYKTGVLEAMGSTGIVRPELRGSLDDLRDRLGVSEEARNGLFLEAAKERMVPMVEWIVLELERTMLTSEQLSKKRDKDFGEDYFKTGRAASGTLGLGSEANIMTDCMNLIDFYRENDLTEQRENGTETIEKKVVDEDGEEKTVSEEVPKVDTIYPITALGSNVPNLNEEIAELLYRQFVVGGFTTQGPQATRYEEARADFGGIIGLTTEKMTEITDSIGSQVYENFIGNAMRTKGALDQQDMMFLANIQGKLKLSEDASEKMLADTQKKILSEEANALLTDEPSPAEVKAFREKCNSMGVDLEQDIGISKQRLTRMFEAEVTPGLTNGEITVESGDTLTEIQESLGLSPDEAGKMLEGIVLKRAAAAMTRMKSELLRGREEECVDIVLRLVRYAQFMNGELDLEIEEATAWKVFNLYEKMDFEGVDAEVVEENKSLLKIALGL